MEIRQSVNRVPTRPIAFVLAVLSLAALALTAAYVLRTAAPAQLQSIPRPIVTACSGMVPDAQDRCQAITSAEQSKAEATHGH